MHQFTEPVVPQDPLTDSDGDDSRPEDGERQKYMFIWNSTYEVCVCVYVCVCVSGWEYMECMTDLVGSAHQKMHCIHLVYCGGERGVY